MIRRRRRQHRKQQHKEDYYSLVEEELEVLIMLEMITKNQIMINAKRNWYVLIPPAHRDLSYLKIVHWNKCNKFTAFTAKK